MGFADDMNRAALSVNARAIAILETAAELTKTSIQYGSELTGALGQPVKSGELQRSWMTEETSPTQRVISTNLPYAKSIEDGISYAHGGTPIVLHSAVGGSHSVAQTTSNFDHIVAAAVDAHGGG